jgi:hypothetical protein
MTREETIQAAQIMLAFGNGAEVQGKMCLGEDRYSSNIPEKEMNWNWQGKLSTYRVVPKAIPATKEELQEMKCFSKRVILKSKLTDIVSFTWSGNLVDKDDKKDWFILNEETMEWEELEFKK